jgi:ubiquinone/menaquinone biosynthesis C-methylase UbiE
MIDIAASKYKCPNCAGADFLASATQWRCGTCGQVFACVAGMPKLYLEDRLGAQDRKLRDGFYDGLFGRFYQFMMPFIVMPVRPWAIAWPHWLAYGAGWLALAGLAASVVGLLATPGQALFAIGPLIVLAAIGWFFSRQQYLFHLLLLAGPTRLSLGRNRFAPTETFTEAHGRVLAPLKAASSRLQILDVSTGSCNSLYRHGWMGLDAEYTAIDLSETMLRQGGAMMSRNGVPVDLVLGDAVDLPFQSDRFDVVLSYGAVNGLSDPARAIAEMARVAKPGGVLLFLDEQIYDGAPPLQRRYFEKVLSGHNVVHRCPVETFPATLTDVRVSQVYEFYYICTARKVMAAA